MYFNADIEKFVKRKQTKIENDNTLEYAEKRNTRVLVHTIELRDQTKVTAPQHRPEGFSSRAIELSDRTRVIAPE